MSDTKKPVAKITAIKHFKTLFKVGNTIVAEREQTKVQKNGEEYWYGIQTEEVLQNIGDIDYLTMYNYDKLTPEGEKMLADHKAKQDEKDEEDDD